MTTNKNKFILTMLTIAYTSSVNEYLKKYNFSESLLFEKSVDFFIDNLENNENIITINPINQNISLFISDFSSLEELENDFSILGNFRKSESEALFTNIILIKSIFKKRFIGYSKQVINNRIIDIYSINLINKDENSCFTKISDSLKIKTLLLENIFYQSQLKNKKEYAEIFSYTLTSFLISNELNSKEKCIIGVVSFIKEFLAHKKDFYSDKRFDFAANMIISKIIENPEILNKTFDYYLSYIESVYVK